MSKGTDTMTAAEFQAILRDGKPTTNNVSFGNRKVRNAKAIEQDGVKFDSRLECYMYNLLTMLGIEFLFQKKYTLQESFRYNGETIRAITYTVDFYLPDYDIAIDTKGITTQQGQLRIKMLKHLFVDLGRATAIELPRTPGECDALVGRLITGKQSPGEIG